MPGYYSETKNAEREAVNRWIRGGGAFDGVIDFDAVLRDPGHPSRLQPRYASPDHLHPNDAGHQAMADAVDLALFRRSPGR
jgi:lysophospholipase L1-like esterase